jgi:hypothetical protein
VKEAYPVAKVDDRGRGRRVAAGVGAREAEEKAGGRTSLKEALPVVEAGDRGREEEGDHGCGGEGGGGGRGCGWLWVEKKAGCASLEEASPATPQVEAMVEGEA